MTTRDDYDTDYAVLHILRWQALHLAHAAIHTRNPIPQPGELSIYDTLVADLNHNPLVP